MTDPVGNPNQAFLQAGMRWIRAVLEARIAASLPPEKKSWWSWRKPPEPYDARAAQKARIAMDEAASGSDIGLITLVNRLGLSAFEQDLLLLAASPEIDTGMPSLMAEAQGDPAKRFPTFALSMSLFAEPSWDAMSPERPLRAQRLLEIHQSGAVSLLAAPLRIDERVVAYIKGLNYLDERLASLVAPLGEINALPPSQEAVAKALSHWLHPADSRGLVQLIGSHAGAKAEVVARAAGLAGRRGYVIHANALPSSADELATFERLWSREAKLQPLVLLVQGVEGVEPLAGEDGKVYHRPDFPRAFARMAGPCALDVRTPLPEAEAPVVSAAPPTDIERRLLWRSVLAIDEHVPSEPAILQLAREFKTSTSQIREFGGRARTFSDVQNDSVSERVETVTRQAWEHCVQHAGAALAGLTRWIAPRASLDDVKLPDFDKRQLERLVAHARQRSIVMSELGFGDRNDRGLGLAALFYGESGTGKTLAAEAVAHSLALGLAVADLATVKSKYIGETEKNLRRIFDAAEEGGAVLFFDEADALFGKRTEVKDSHDRYANIEINYLLMRMENFHGVAILATNQKHALDAAFVRRLRFLVRFPFPGPLERKAIWRSIFPRQMPLGELDYDRLSRFQLSGGSIFNAALAAAHSAAAGDGRVDMPDVLDAIHWELRKMERPVSDREFRQLSVPVTEPVEVVA